jgi:hypothetical protein
MQPSKQNRVDGFEDNAECDEQWTQNRTKGLSRSLIHGHCDFSTSVIPVLWIVYGNAIYRSFAALEALLRCLSFTNLQKQNGAKKRSMEGEEGIPVAYIT